jgi:glucokinase
MKRGYFIGLDMGGTNLRCGAVSPAGDVLMLRRAPAYAMSAADRLVANICANVEAVAHDATQRGMGAPRGIGVAVPGPLDLDHGTVTATPHVSAWRSFPLRARLERELRRRVTIENDANAWALGEFWRGAAQGRCEVVLLTLGTGVGGGLIVGGRIVHGIAGMAGELGHVTVEPDGVRCDCGAPGCLEAYASASGIKHLIEQRLPRGAAMPPEFSDRNGEFAVRRLSNAARNGNELARSVLGIAGKYLGIAIAAFVNIFNPELVVIGGGMAGALPLMRQPMMREVRARAFQAALEKTRIVRAGLGERAGVVGAAYAAMSQTDSARPARK